MNDKYEYISWEDFQERYGHLSKDQQLEIIIYMFEKLMDGRIYSITSTVTSGLPL